MKFILSKHFRIRVYIAWNWFYVVRKDPQTTNKSHCFEKTIYLNKSIFVFVGPFHHRCCILKPVHKIFLRNDVQIHLISHCQQELFLLIKTRADPQQISRLWIPYDLVPAGTHVPNFSKRCAFYSVLQPSWSDLSKKLILRQQHGRVLLSYQRIIGWRCCFYCCMHRCVVFPHEQLRKKLSLSHSDDDVIILRRWEQLRVVTCHFMDSYFKPFD